MIPSLFVLAHATMAQLVFTPTSISMIDGILHNDPLQVKLANQPPANTDVQVFFAGQGVTFGACNQNFTSANWNQNQQNLLSGQPFRDQTATTATIDVQQCVNGQSTKTTFPITRTMAPARTCIAQNDNRYVLLDGYQVDAQYTGLYNLYTSYQTTVQTDQRQFESDVAVIQRVAIRYMSTIFLLDVIANQNADGNTAQTGNKDNIQYTHTPATAPDNTDRHTVTLPDGSSIVMISDSAVNSVGNKFNYLTVTISYPTGPIVKSGGHCNRLNSGNRFLLPDDTAVDRTQADRFFDSWKVAEGKNLFQGQLSPITNSATLTCTMPAACPSTSVTSTTTTTSSTTTTTSAASNSTSSTVTSSTATSTTNSTSTSTTTITSSITSSSASSVSRTTSTTSPTAAPSLGSGTTTTTTNSPIAAPSLGSGSSTSTTTSSPVARTDGYDRFDILSSASPTSIGYVLFAGLALLM